MFCNLQKIFLGSFFLLGGIYPISSACAFVPATELYIGYVQENNKPLAGKRVVTFGDSVTEFKDLEGKTYSDYLAEITGAEVINVGIGGTQFRQRTMPTMTPGSSLESYASLDIVNMIKALCSEDYRLQQKGVAWIKKNLRNDKTSIIDRLMSIDWQQVDAVTFLAGTNDFTNGHQLGTIDSKDANTTLGAINLIIDLLLTKYPHLQVYWFTPTVRWYAKSLEQRTEATWCGNRKNNENLVLKDYVTAIEKVVKENHIPVCNLYETLGWNRYNFQNYFVDKDGTHPYKGMDEIARKMAGFMISNGTF